MDFIIKVIEGLILRWKNRDSLRTLGAARSSQWPKVRAEHLAKYPNCAVCGGKEMIECHHKQPFHLFPERELDESNLISLCSKRNCHLIFGHYFNFKKFNPNVDKEAKEWREKIGR